MDWSRAKMIFIVTFLCLNLFLGYQLHEKQEQAKLNAMTHATIQERLEDNRIEVEIENAEEVNEGAPITGTVRQFQEELFEELFGETLERQTLTLIDDTTLRAEFENPFSLNAANLTATVSAFLQQFVYEGEMYQIAKYNEEEQYIGLYQTYRDRKIDQYEREDFHLKLYVTDDLEVDSYEQTFITVNEQEGREQELLSPLKALETLMNDHYIPPDTVIEEPELGYYSLIQLEANFQMYSPVWRFKVNDEYYFVDALNGEIQTIS
ncbi:two-component system regulatory protein YycI [Salipaludibacillus sp. HK11]|uniref:two-component system regulatory protein YycI n=1 Tax=Salipaludibacillus sp. HK11 TaxID=3394320 RepID=UPI0039FD9C2A